MFDSILANLLSSALWKLGASVVVSLGSAALLEYLKTKWPNLVLVIKSVVKTAVYVFAICLMVNIWLVLPSTSARSTRNSVLQDIKKWLDDSHFAIQTMPDDQQFFFRLATTSQSGIRIAISRRRDIEASVIIEQGLMLDVDDAQVMGKFSLLQRSVVTEELVGDLSLSKTIAAINVGPPMTVIVQKVVPIESLTHDSFLAAIDDIVFGGHVARNSLHRAMRDVALKIKR